MNAKKILFIYLSCCLFLNANAQTENTIVNDNSSWAILKYGLGAFYIPGTVITEYVFFDGDSTFLGKQYKKVFSYKDQLHENIIYNGLMREQDQKTYWIIPNTGTEILLYDFSLQEGMYFGTDITMYIKEVGFVNINGEQKKQIKLSYEPNETWVTDTWIEGIGSLRGLFKPNLYGSGGMELLCFYQNEELSYKNPDYDECYCDTSENLYILLLQQRNQWNELVKNPSLPPEYQYEKTYITKIGNDTLINGVSYSKVLTTKDELSAICLNNGYIREDVENQKIYYKPTVNNPEILLYDFNAQVGDTIQSYDFQANEAIEIVVINKFYELITMHYKRIMKVRSMSLDGNYIKDHVWIEGIGDIDGLLQSTKTYFPSGSEQIFLHCFLQNNDVSYDSSFFYYGAVNLSSEDCFVWNEPTIKIQSIPTNNINIYPNPVDDILTISSTDNAISRIEIFDISGRNIYNQKYYTNTINLSSLSKGVYFLKIYDINNFNSMFKFIKN